MNIKRFFSLLFLFTLTLAGAGFSAEDAWEKEFTKDGITVYTRPVEGSPLKEFKGEALINAPIEVCTNVLNDIEGQTKWWPDRLVSREVRRSENTVISYSETKAPWPVSNRDVIIKTLITISGDKVTLDFTAVDDPKLVPLKEGVVRMTEVKGAWVFSKKNGNTFVSYQARINPAGSIPGWLANKTSVDQPYKTLLGLKEMTKDPKYQVK